MLLHFRQNTKVYCLPISSHFYDDWISNATLKIVLKSPRCSGCRIVHKKDLNNDASKSLKNIPLCVKEASVTFIVWNRRMSVVCPPTIIYRQLPEKHLRWCNLLPPQNGGVTRARIQPPIIYPSCILRWVIGNWDKKKTITVNWIMAPHLPFLT